MYAGDIEDGLVKLHGCHFHYTQCLIKKLKEACRLLVQRYNEELPNHNPNAFRFWVTYTKMLFY